jgi:hypothetical protein
MNKGVAHPLTSTVHGITPGAVRVEGVEITQAIQDMNHSVTLVAGKVTVVRVYVSRPSGTDIKVSGEIAVRRTPTGPAKLVPSLNTAKLKSAQTVKLRSMREDVSLSLNFLLPPELTTEGQIHVQVGTLKDAATGAPVTCEGCGGAGVSVSFIAASPLRVKLIRLRYRTPTQPNTHLASAADVALIKSWLKRAYPVAEVASSVSTVDANFSPPFDKEDPETGESNDCNDANAQVSAIRNLDISGNADRRTHYYGLVADSGGFMRGCANAIPAAANPAAVASGPCGPSDFGWDTDGSYGDWYTAHELGHTLGRKHIGACSQTSDDPSYPFPKGQLSKADGAFVGLDVGDSALNLPMVALPGTKWHDVMSYCERQWLSSYTYEAIRKRLLKENALGAGPVPEEEDESSVSANEMAADELEMKMDAGQFINVVATVNLTRGTGKIKYVNPVAAVLVPKEEPDSPVLIRVRSAAGQVLQEYYAGVKLNTCEEPNKDRKGIVDVALPRQVEAASLELLVGDQVVDTFRPGAAPPPLSNVRRRQLEEDETAAVGLGTSEDAVSLEWDAGFTEDEGAEGDAAAGNLTYNVQVSTDGGQTWQTVAVGLPSPTATIDRGQFEDADKVMVRVIATNGFENSVVTSDEMPVEKL